jgi:hypothetical protein
MNALTGEPLIDHAALEAEIVARDREVANPYTKDLQLTAIRGARRFIADRITRVAAPHRVLDPDAGPLIAIRLSILTRKTLGGLQTDLSSRVLTASGEPLPGLYAAGEVAGFGGGGVARLPRARGHLPRRLPVLGPRRRARGCRRARLAPHSVDGRSVALTNRSAVQLRAYRRRAAGSVGACSPSRCSPPSC